MSLRVCPNIYLIFSWDSGRVTKDVHSDSQCGIKVKDAKRQDTGVWKCTLAGNTPDGQTIRVEGFMNVIVGDGKYYMMQEIPFNS